MPRSERPLDPGDTPLLRFAADLRKLREDAGSPVYRDLTVKAHYSVAVLSEAAGGRKLPSLAVALAYVDACGGDLTEWERRWRETAEAQEISDASDTGQAPYPGLSALQVEDAGRFHGRGALLAHLSNQILNRRLVVVFGASGAGKSSLLRAGLAAASLRDGVDGLGPQPTIVFTPGAHPIDECALGLAGTLDVPVTALRGELRADPTALHLRLRQALADNDDDREALVIVDQFEEVFTLCADEEERLVFITALMHLAAASTGGARLVLGVRADFFGHCLHYPQLRQVLGEGPVLVGAMTADELRLAITRPAIDLGYAVETALVTRLVSEATNQPGVLPLMSHALLETWRRRQGMTLTAAGYDAAGGISHALSRTAESVYTGLLSEQQVVARQVFLRLTALGDGTEDTRRRVDRAELEHVEGLDEVLTALIDARLVTVDRDSVDIAHEALISHWPRLREWLTEDRDSLRSHRQLTEAAEIWDSLNRDDGALYRGARLELAREWVRSCTPSLSYRERAYFDRSVQVCHQEAVAAKRQTRRLKRLVALLVVLAVALAGTTVFSLATRQTVASQQDDATIRNVIDEIPTVAISDRALAGELALAVYRQTPSARTRGLVLGASANSVRNPTMGAAQFNAWNQSLDSKSARIAYVRSDGSVEVDQLQPDGATHQLVTLPVPTLATNLAVCMLSPDGRHVAVLRPEIGAQSTVELWDIGDDKHPKLLRTYPFDTAVGAAFSPDGRVLVVTSSGSTGMHLTGGNTVIDPMDQHTWLWDVNDPAAAAPLAVLPVAAQGTEFSADGGTLLTGPVTVPGPADTDPSTSPVKSGTAHIWDVKQVLSGKPAQPEVLATVGGNDFTALSPGGRSIAVTHTAGKAGSLTLWQRGANPAKLVELPAGVDPRSPAFSPNGRYLGLLQGDNTAVVWDVSDPSRPVEVASMTAPASGADLLTFTADDRLTVVAAGTVMTSGLDVDAATAKICAAAKEKPVPLDQWNGYFPSMTVPQPCPS